MNIEQYKEIIHNGSLFYPAWKHYGGPTRVKCDRCQKSDIGASIGYRDNDLCLICVEKITQYLKQKEPQQQIPESFKPPMSVINSNSSNLTLMISDMYNNQQNPTNIGNLLNDRNRNPFILTRMEQNMYKQNKDLDSFFPNVKKDKSFEDAESSNLTPLSSNTYDERFW